MNTEESLTKVESVTLEECEQVIRAGLATFVEVGNALLSIRDNRLYRISHRTFEAYCKGKWKMTPQYANRLVAAASSVKNLETIVSKPTRESQVRPLTKLEPEQQKQAWEHAVSTAGGEPTSKQVEEAVMEFNSQNTTQEPTIPEPPISDGKFNNLVPKRGSFKDWQRLKVFANEVKQIASQMQLLHVDVENKMRARDLCKSLADMFNETANTLSK